MLMKLYICMEICLSLRFMSIILWPGMTHLVPTLSQNASCGWGAWCHSLSFETFSFSNSVQPSRSVVSNSLWPWKVVVEPQKTPGFLASRGEEFNLRPEMRLDRSELLCNKVLLKYKREREIWHRHQRGTERVPHQLVFSWMLYSY